MKDVPIDERLARIEDDVGRLADALYDLRLREAAWIRSDDWDEPDEHRCPFLRVARPLITVIGWVLLVVWIARGCP